MPSAAVERVLAGLEKVRPNGDGWTARCPSHEDRNPSLSVTEGDDARCLVHCFAGCRFEEIVAALGLRPGELFAGSPSNGARPRPLSKQGPPATRLPTDALETVERLSRRKRSREGRPELALDTSRRSLTLQEYADAFRLDPAFLSRLGVRTGTDPTGRALVEIPYRDPAGCVVAVRRRHALDGPRRFTWRPGDKPRLYGLAYLARMRERGCVLLVEGESDAHVLWFHRIPALGIPGAPHGWKDERDAEHLDGIGTIYIVREPDQAGEKLVQKVATSRIADRVRVVQLDGAKDPAELYLRNPESFDKRFRAALRAAVPIATTGPDEGEQLRHRAAVARFNELAVR